MPPLVGAIAYALLGGAVGFLLDRVVGRLPESEPLHPLPRRRTLVVGVTAACLFFLWLTFGPKLALLPATLYMCFLVVVAFIDIEHWLILNKLTYPGAVAAVPLSLLYGNTIVECLLGGLLGFGLFLIIFAVGNSIFGAGRIPLGLGDVKLGGVIGLFAGISGTLPAFFLASVLAGTVAAGLLLSKRVGRHDHLPYGPFICAGAAMQVLFY